MKDFLSWIQKVKNNIGKRLTLAELLLIGVFLLFILTSFLNINKIINNQISDNLLLDSPFATFITKPYPKLKTVLGANNLSKNNLNSTSAQAYIILDNNSQTILISKNEHLRFSMASTTKIMTALTALESFKLDDILTVKEARVEGSKVGLVWGEKMSLENLLYGMLLPSGNDAAVTIAQNYIGGEKAFIEKMNQNARNLHLVNTHFSDASGLDDDGDYTTALDLARLASMAMKNPIFSRIVNTKYAVIANSDGTRTYPINNLNKLLGTDGIDGIKTGFTEEAGGVLVTSKKENGHNIILVVMKSDDRFLDTENLLSIIKGNIVYKNF